MSTPLTRSAYATGHFELSLDGSPSSAYVNIVEGEFMRAALVSEPVGTENLRIKHTSVVEVDPVTVEIGMSGTNPLTQWVQKSINKNFERRSGQIVHADFDFNAIRRVEFTDALIQEITFPALDGAGKSDVYMKVKFLPEMVKTSRAGGKISSPISGKQKEWMVGGFRLEIDGYDDFKYTQKIDAFTIKQGVKRLYYGSSRDAEIEPTNLEFPNLSITMAEMHANAIRDRWYQKYIVEGDSEDAMQTQGRLCFLDTKREKTIYEIELREVGLAAFTIQPSKANEVKLKTVKIDLFIGEMKVGQRGSGHG